MKLLFMIGNTAVGKMTVGQALAKRTEFKLFHNHMTIEPVLELFGGRNNRAVNRLRDVIFEEFAASDQYGMIFTYMWAFDQQGDWDYIEHVKSIFAPYGTEFYCVELIAPQAVRLKRNGTENRLKNKASKRNIEFSNRLLLSDDRKYRCESLPGEVPFDNYLRIENADVPADEAARMICERFGF